MAPESEGLFGYYKVTKFVKQGSIPTITTTPYENGIWQRFTGTSFIVSNLPDDNYIIIVAEDGPFIGTGTITLPADACRTAEIAIVTNCKKLDCDNYYIKSTIPNTNPAVESYKLNRKTTNNRLFDDLSLSLATFDGTSIPANLQYTWPVPAGQAPLSGAGGAVNKIGSYTLSLSNGLQTCPIMLSLSGTLCDDITPADYCTGGAAATIKPEATDISEMAVGDLFTAANFKITITELTSSNSPFTGKGIAQLILPGKLPMEVNVTFEGAIINDCYQLKAADKFVTDYDPNWGNVINLNDLFAKIKNTMLSINDLLGNYTSGDLNKLLSLQQTLNSYKPNINSDPSFNTEQKTQLITAIDDLNSTIACFLPPTSGSRVSNSCTLNDLQQQSIKSMEVIAGADDDSCPCNRPTDSAGKKEGDEQLVSGTKQSMAHEAPSYTCYKKFIFHTSFTGSRSKTGWYSTKEYENVVTFVKDKVAPVIFIHGTFSNPSAFSGEFKSKLFGYLKTNLNYSTGATDAKWSGENTSVARESAAQELSLIINSDLGKKIIKDLNFEKHLILICHSHGGNVAKLLKNKLETLDGAWTIDVINIETPQRADIQTNSTKGNFISFWSDTDLVQWAGSNFDSISSSPNPGPAGPRIDPKADLNVNLKNEVSLTSYIPAYYMFRWILNSFGHSLQNDDFFQSQIYFIVKENF